ncbi:Uncharacterised protein [uncultured archaeon]|nr:Uncharacterised protein [uncultured archaeon]
MSCGLVRGVSGSLLPAIRSSRERGREAVCIHGCFPPNRGPSVRRGCLQEPTPRGPEGCSGNFCIRCLAQTEARKGPGQKGIHACVIHLRRPTLLFKKSLKFNCKVSLLFLPVSGIFLARPAACAPCRCLRCDFNDFPHRRREKAREV